MREEPDEELEESEGKAEGEPEEEADEGEAEEEEEEEEIGECIGSFSLLAVEEAEAIGDGGSKAGEEVLICGGVEGTAAAEEAETEEDLALGGVDSPEGEVGDEDDFILSFEAEEGDEDAEVGEEEEDDGDDSE